MKMHNPNNPAPQVRRADASLGDYSDSMLELDYNIGRIMDAIRAEAPDTIVIVTADNGAWQDAYPDAGTMPFRGMKKARALKAVGGCRASCGGPGKFRPARSTTR